MPNVLLIGASSRLVAKFLSTDRWSVGIGVHDRVPPNLADRVRKIDPRHWKLVVDDCDEDSSSLDELALLPVSFNIIDNSYLGECEKAHLVRFVTEHEHLTGKVRSYPNPGAKSLAFIPKQKKIATALSDFVENHRDEFTNSHLMSGRSNSNFNFSPVFENEYSRPVVLTSKTTPSDLFFLPIRDSATRDGVIYEFCERVAPRIWPNLYSDSFLPRRVIELMERKTSISMERRAIEQELENAIQAELSYIAPYINLIHMGGDELKDLVALTLRSVLMGEVTDLDKELANDEPKGLDLLTRWGSYSCFIEVRASATGNARRDDLTRFERNFTRSQARFGSVEGKVLIFNGMFAREDTDRNPGAAFSDDVADEAGRLGILLVTTSDLLALVGALRENSVSLEAVLESLHSPHHDARWTFPTS
jgi:hypothetical protein